MAETHRRCSAVLCIAGLFLVYAALCRAEVAVAADSQHPLATGCEASIDAATRPLRSQLSKVKDQLIDLEADLQDVRRQKDICLEQSQIFMQTFEDQSTAGRMCGAEKLELERQNKWFTERYWPLIDERDSLKVQLAAAQAAQPGTGQCPSTTPQACDITVGTAVTALTSGLKHSCVSAWNELLAITEEAKAGKADKLAAMSLAAVSACRGATSSAVAFVRVMADEHLPPAAKEKLAELSSAAGNAWQQYVVQAQWAQPAIMQLKAVNAEVKQALTQLLQQSPALAPYADPVLVQLAVYAVFGMPLLLLLVLPMAFQARSAKAVSAAPKKPKSAKKPARKA